MTAAASRPRLRALLRDPSARALFAAAWILAPAVEASLRLAGVSRTIAGAAAVGRRTRASAVAATDAERLVAAAFRAHPILSGRCLARSLVQWALQHERGARLVIGVRRGEPARELDLDAHAWVELGGSRPEGAEGWLEIAAWTARGDARSRGGDAGDA